MNFYNIHIGDFRGGSANLSRLERWIYRDMLDFYYDKEKPLPLDFDLLCDEIGVSEEQEKKAVAKILRVKFSKSEYGYHNARCDHEISKYHAKAEISIKNGRLGGRRRADTKPENSPSGTQQVNLANQTPSESQANQEPRTKNQEPELKTLTNPNGLVVPGVADDVPRPDSPNPCPHQAIIEIYHEALPMCPKIRDWTPARQAHLRARWNEDKRRQSLDYWAEFFTYVGQCDFLVGRARPRNKDSPPFIADLEWLVKHANFTKIRERKYENRDQA